MYKPAFIPTLDAATVSSALSSALEAMQDTVFACGPKTSYEEVPLRHTTLESQVKRFTEQAIEKVKDMDMGSSAKSQQRSHAHCETQLLIYFHGNNLLSHVESCFGASKVPCGNCSMMVAAYVNAYPDSPLIDLGGSSYKFYPDFNLDWDIFVPQMRRDFVLLLQEEIGEQVIGWMNHQERLARKPWQLRERVWSLAQYVAGMYY
ncbi:hypothetical protein PM082_015644 [Marasmius tenuissimus]|nr:hypothetical protein PM082_015644 [Marasmius tenuissimus]